MRRNIFQERKITKPIERADDTVIPANEILTLRTRAPGSDEFEDAYALAEQHEIVVGLYAGKALLPRLLENEKTLNRIQRELAHITQTHRSVPPAAEWLLDNYYIVAQQLEQARQDLAPLYYGELPKLARTALVGFPRVFGIAVELCARSDNRLSLDVLVRFLRAYQERAPLSIGEVWAIPIMLRIALIENLRGVVEEVRADMELQRAANTRAEELINAAAEPTRELPGALARLEQDANAQHSTFLVQLVLRLRDQDPAVAPALHWLEAQMGRTRTTLEELIRTENQRRAHLGTSAGNIITSLRLLASLDWHDFFDRVSCVERALNEDPGGAYPKMDFATRDRYRHVVEKLARHNPTAEVEIAQRVVQLAAETFAKLGLDEKPGFSPGISEAIAERRRHVGYFLMDAGRTQLEAAIGYHPPLAERARRLFFQNATACYLGLIALLTFLLVAGAVTYAASVGASEALLIVVALVTLLPLSVIAVGVVNWTLRVELEPQPPPKLELRQGIPPEYRTIVVIPALIVSQAGLDYLLKHLELRFLANRDENLHFAILGDFADAPLEHMPEDEVLLKDATRHIRELNEKHERADAFFYFHRRRIWNASEDCWMGWERKRGKLAEFNLLLRGRATSYFVQEGALEILSQIKFVITLDADTMLPMQVARHLVGALAHPLNRPVLDPTSRQVIQGYGIIQPRVDVVAPAVKRSLFARLFAGDTGLDPYASVVSDVYQDLFQRAVYIGKGIYDVDALLGVLHGRFPENLLLSHDLIEGGFARVGFASDIELLEDFPSGFDTFAQRQHRWVRGDWQITDWLFPRVRDAAGEVQKNTLPLIERWKIFDNLRRSLVPLATLVLFLAAWTVLPEPRAGWTLLALFCILFPFFRSALEALTARPVGETFKSYLWAVTQALWALARRGMITLIFLLYLTTLNVDAIASALLRRTVFHRHLLEWTSHAVAERGPARGLGEYISRMWLSSVLALALAAFLAVVTPSSLAIAAPLLLLWFLAPTIAHALSQPIAQAQQPLSEAARRELRATARRIWRFYEDFAGADDHWLPPDNYQIEPKPVVAHRTSPTNIGFLLLATLAAYDFGYIERTEWVERIERIFNTLDTLERWRGHFLNWYDTLTLAPLYPRYVSTVDSGNLAASLITLKQACFELIQTPRDPARVWHGLADTLTVLQDTLQRQDGHEVVTLRGEVERLSAELPAQTLSLETFLTRARYLARLAKRLGVSSHEIRGWCDALVRQAARAHAPSDPSLHARLERLAQRAGQYAADMDFAFLYDTVRGVLAIGYNVTQQRRDDSYFDLMASEARLTSFLTIARGEIPVKHWFRMSRPLTRLGGKATLLSWGGTMFEYLMPPLLLREEAPSLLQTSDRAALQAQIAYGARQNLPWGVSESGFYAFDYQFNYQYRAFGVPELSLKRELVLPRVIAPYATFLALPFAPQASWRNLNALRALGGAGEYGFFEALDFSPEHLATGERVAVVRSYMAHHQGMAFAALDNFFYQNVMQERFHREAIIAAAELLLQERVPQHAPLLSVTKEERPLLRLPTTTLGPALRHLTTPHTFTPRAHLLSNGSYSVMLTNGGAGYSAWRDDLVTRWREDATLDGLGTFCYIQDVENGHIWSNTFQPTGVASEFYDVTFGGETVEFVRRDRGIEAKTTIFVAPTVDAEIRQLTLTNFGEQTRTLDLTSYAEVVLDAPRNDAAHPAFSKLFVESEFDAERNALLFKRRPRAAEQPERWAVHFLISASSAVAVREYETDRARFIGRGRTLADPAALYAPLSKTVGATLDPAMCLRTRVRLVPNEPVTLAWITGAAGSRAAAIELCESLLDLRDLERGRDGAHRRAQTELQQLGITPADANLFQRFASRVLYPDPQLRAPLAVLARNTRGQDVLWAYGISGDYPIVLVRVGRGEGLQLVRQTVRAHEFWRQRNLRVDLVIVDEQPTSYSAEVSNAILSWIGASPYLDQRGGIFVRRRDLIAVEDFVVLETLARVNLHSERGELADQLNLSGRQTPTIGARARRLPPTPPAALREDTSGRAFFNGIGGFSEEGQEYVITLREGEWTPTPWTNVIANSQFGCLVTDAGLAMTWAGNSQQNKLTPWSNDPVSDPPAEAIYLQEEHALWTPTPLPIREAEAYTIRHGAGYSVFEYTGHDLEQTLRVFVAPDEPVKILQLTLKNLAAHPRRLRATYYVEWVLGALRQDTQHFVVTELEASLSAILARNTYGGTGVAFAAALQPLSGASASRAEFLGRHGTYALPAALVPNAKPMAEQTGANLDPCAALQIEVDLPPHEATDVFFLLGQGDNRTQARALIQKFREPEALARARQESGAAWNALLEAVQVKTPDRAMDLLLNRWLLYQTLACRVWSRAAFYQAGGAFGFRDQLQDVMALVFAAPELAREHILRAAARQFPEGDVMHWWHESARGAQGVRTRISDDYLWLPYATAYYVRAIGDAKILDEQLAFVELPRLEPDQEEIYGTAQMTSETASLYEHCVRALDHGLRFGAHGLPLMGTGDWNDGMNRVGVQGKGESVWLGWFLYANLDAFAALAETRGDATGAQRYRAQAERLQHALNEDAWDGDWYRRAYFDDGSPLGSKENAECKIDAIAQAWAVISDAAPIERQDQALRAVQEQLVRDQEKMILLLTPPFVNSQPNPGYIQGYVAGIRENGGQYTHGALWLVLAHALRGDGDRAHELYAILNPLNHTRTYQDNEQYRVEPYVIAADIYSHPQHHGRGGWTWYTGSAAWMYRIGVEHILGLQRRGNFFTVDPCIPHSWSQYEIMYRYRGTRYEITVENPEGVSHGVQWIELDEVRLPTRDVPLNEDGATHRARVMMGKGDDLGARQS